MNAHIKRAAIVVAREYGETASPMGFHANEAFAEAFLAKLDELGVEVTLRDPIQDIAAKLREELS